MDRSRHLAASRLPFLIRPRPVHLTIAVTAACNLRCVGCGYGRDFMVGASLPLETAFQVIDDACDVGFHQVRFYGGEPLLHPHLPQMIERATHHGMEAYVTTNGVLLDKKVDELYSAGLRWLSVGFYGVGDAYDRYTQRPGRFEQLDSGLAAVRTRHADRLQMQLNWVLMRPTCTIEALDQAWAFASKHDMLFNIDLVSYSLPFFNPGPERELLFRPEDRERVTTVGSRLLELKRTHPDRFPQSEFMIRAIPDLLMDGPRMRIPCDAYESLWVGADGSVQLCDVTFPLGNVNHIRLRDIVLGDEHKKACRNAFELKCPNCTCRIDSRILRDPQSVRRYRC